MKLYRGQMQAEENIPPPTGPAIRSSEEYERPSVVERVNNRIYFYASINSENILKLNKELMDLDSEHISNALRNSESTFRPIWLHINSGGGYVFDGLAAMDQVALCKCPVHTVVDGVCASAATFMSIRAKKRYIKPNSFMLIHQISSGCWGKYEEFKDEIQNLDKFMNLIIGIYEKNTKIPKKVLQSILKRDIYFDASECLKYGLVDEILK